GPARPEPLPRRRRLVPVPAPARVARRRGRRQDAGLELDDRPGGRRPRPAARRGAGRLQVVRRRPPRRLARVRLRGERRRVVRRPRAPGAHSGRGTRARRGGARPLTAPAVNTSAEVRDERAPAPRCPRATAPTATARGPLLIDPLVRLHRIDENSAAEMSAVLGELRALQRAYQLAL